MFRRKSFGSAFLILSFVALPTLVKSDDAKKDDEAKHESSKSEKGLVECDMEFKLSGWSAIYATSKGEGTIKCDNGETAKVAIKSKGGGITFGKSEVLNGTGHFSGAKNIQELYGSYAQSEAGAGAGKSANAQAMTKGEVSLALKGTGRGVNVGFSFGKFTITPL